MWMAASLPSFNEARGPVLPASVVRGTRHQRAEPGGGARTYGKHIVFVGLMGSGKTTIGEIVASQLQFRQTDSDVDVLAATGRTARQIADEDGADVIHDEEARQLLRRLAEPTPYVIGAAASTIERATCREAVHRGAMVVWVRVRLDTMLNRFASQAHRPILGATVGDMFRDQMRTRYPLYAEVADLTLAVDDDTITPADAARVVVSQYRDVWLTLL